MSGKCLVREMTRLGNDPSGKRPIMETTRWGNILSGKRLVSHYQYCHFYIYKVAASVCVSVFRISQKCADRFPWNFSRFIWVIGRRERIKKFRPLMCKNWENGAKWPISRKSHGSCALTCTMACGPISRARLRSDLHLEPIARWSGGVARSLRWGTVSNAFVLLTPV